MAEPIIQGGGVVAGPVPKEPNLTIRPPVPLTADQIAREREANAATARRRAVADAVVNGYEELPPWIQGFVEGQAEKKPVQTVLFSLPLAFARAALEAREKLGFLTKAVVQFPAISVFFAVLSPEQANTTEAELEARLAEMQAAMNAILPVTPPMWRADP